MKYYIQKMILLASCLAPYFIKAQVEVAPTKSTYGYLIFPPKEKAPPTGFPILLFLHGSGERGADLDKVKVHGPPKFAADTSGFPFLVVAPQCPADSNWNAEKLLRILDQVERKYPVDYTREYVSGLSMGGSGVWRVAIAAPDRFAAIAPICGRAVTQDLCRARNVPVWMFHGDADNAVPIKESELMHEKLSALNADIKYTIYPGLGHDSWTTTYENPALYAWLLSHHLDEDLNQQAELLPKYAGKYKSGKDILEIRVDPQGLAIKYADTRKFQPLILKHAHMARPEKGTRMDEEIYFESEAGPVITGLRMGRCEKGKLWKKL